MSDFANRRMMMVDTQVRPSDVTKFPIIEAMLAVPRELYVPADKQEAAYIGTNVELAPGRVVLDPRSLAKMLDALDLLPEELVLDIGTGLGYAAAIMARMAGTVVAVEDDEARAADAQRILSEQGVDNAVVVTGPLAAGAPKHGPYDVIVLQGGIEHLPDTLIAQLKEGGRVAAIFMAGGLGTVRVGFRVGNAIDWRFIFNATAPVLPGFARERAFVL